MKSSPDNTPLVQPLIELLGSASKFGSNFNRPGDTEHLKETLANVRSLKDRALSGAFMVTSLTEDEPGLVPAVEFLMELAADLSAIERRITDTMLAKAA
jgi:hypothetical protein